MELIRANLDRLDKDDQFLFACWRPRAFDAAKRLKSTVRKSKMASGFVWWEPRRRNRCRRVPFPADLLPHLPQKITGQLIPGRMDTASKRLREWLTEIGITDPAKAPMHSFRHRAKRRLINADVPGT